MDSGTGNLEHLRWKKSTVGLALIPFVPCSFLVIFLLFSLFPPSNYRKTNTNFFLGFLKNFSKKSVTFLGSWQYLYQLEKMRILLFLQNVCRRICGKEGKVVDVPKTEISRVDLAIVDDKKKNLIWEGRIHSKAMIQELTKALLS